MPVQSRRKTVPPPAVDAVPDDMRRRDQEESRPETLPTEDEARTGEEPVGGGFTPSEDGGVDQHPIHDSDQEDATPSDYEREIDRLDAAVDKRI
ncbi:MAG TPA: hypothetical protein VFA57_06875 [Pseudolabrys sp.]|jgi:hypothetical protein|nr:hypothetical protein [Pseudolabrys sp.]